MVLKSRMYKKCELEIANLLIISSIWIIETKNFNSNPCFFNLVKLVEISLAVLLLNYVNVGRRQAIEAIINGLANLLLENASENYQKIYMIFNILK